MNFFRKIIIWYLVITLGFDVLFAYGLTVQKKQIQKLEDSVVMLQEEPPEEPPEEPVKLRIDCPLDDATQQMIQDKCEEYNVDFALVMAVIYTESRFQSDVVSSTDDYGLMQINKMNHEWLSETLGITDFLNPEQNVTAGLYILSNLFDKYDNPSQVLMVYNMGETGAKKHWNDGVYATPYSLTVMMKYEEYKEGMCLK